MLKTSDRVAFSPAEFAALFGKSQTWGYRQIYAGKVKAITEHGRILIPALEVENILKTAGIYDGIKAKPPKGKAEIQRLTPKLKNAWQDFIHQCREGTTSSKARRPTMMPGKPSAPGASREAALRRLTKVRPAAK